MTVANFIDTTLHASTFPSTYVPPGPLQALGVTTGGTVASTTYTTAANMTSGPASGDSGVVIIGHAYQDPQDAEISGYFTGTGNVLYIPIGFAPMRIQFINWTDTKRWTWMYGAPATDSFYEVASADPTIDTNSLIVVTADAAGGVGDVTYITISSSLNVSAKAISFRIEG